MKFEIVSEHDPNERFTFESESEETAYADAVDHLGYYIVEIKDK